MTEVGSIRRARFAVPVPSRVSETGERIRLVDPTGTAVAWLDCGEAIVIRTMHVQLMDATWQEIIHDRPIMIPGTDTFGSWSLIVRDPTMAHLRWQGETAIDLHAEIAEGILSVVEGDLVRFSSEPQAGER